MFEKSSAKARGTRKPGSEVAPSFITVPFAVWTSRNTLRRAGALVGCPGRLLLVLLLAVAACLSGQVCVAREAGGEGDTTGTSRPSRSSSDRRASWRMASLELRIRNTTRMLESFRKSVAQPNRPPKMVEMLQGRIERMEAQLERYEKELAELKAKGVVPTSRPVAKTTSRPKRDTSNSPPHRVDNLPYPEPPGDVGKGPWPPAALAGGVSLSARLAAIRVYQRENLRLGEMMALTRPMTVAERAEFKKLGRKYQKGGRGVLGVTPAELFSTIPASARGKWKDFQAWEKDKTRKPLNRINDWMKANARNMVYEATGDVFWAVNSSMGWHAIILHTAVVDGATIPVSVWIQGGDVVKSSKPIKPGDRVRVRVYGSNPGIFWRPFFARDKKKTFLSITRCGGQIELLGK